MVYGCICDSWQRWLQPNVTSCVGNVYPLLYSGGRISSLLQSRELKVGFMIDTLQANEHKQSVQWRWEPQGGGRSAKIPTRLNKIITF